jgi:SEC-C motif
VPIDNRPFLKIVNIVANVANQRYNVNRVLRLLMIGKEYALQHQDQELAVHIFYLQQAVEIHSNYFCAFSLLQQHEFYEAWCKLEQVEKGLLFFHSRQKDWPDYWDKFLVSGKYKFIKEHVSRWQELFPYKLFISPGMTYKQTCSICNNSINPRKPCGHNDGEIYNGEVRVRLLSDIRYDHIVIVENPANKFCVLFPINESDEVTNGYNKSIDLYDYSLVKEVVSCLTDPFQAWDYSVREVERDRDYFESIGIGENDPCPCGSDKKYMNCCINKAITGSRCEVYLD